MESNPPKNEKKPFIEKKIKNEEKVSPVIKLIPSVLNSLDIFWDITQRKPTIQNVDHIAQHFEQEKSLKTTTKKNPISIIVQELPQGFKQIVCDATKEEILNYFMSLAKEENNLLGKNYMKESDVEEFVKKNFAIFNCTPTGKYFPINLTKSQKGRLRCFITQFYIEYGSKTVNETRNYALLLVHNFEIFKEDKLSSLMNNMQLKKSPVEKNRIHISTKK